MSKDKNVNLELTPQKLIRFKLDSRIEELLITPDEIEIGCQKAADWINKKYKNKKFMMLGILKGCIPFIGKLIDKIKPDMTLDFMTVSSFKGKMVAEGAPKIVMDLSENVKGKNVLLVEDVVDTGNTISLVMDMLKFRGAKSVNLITFIDKPDKRKTKVKIDYSCYTLPDKFLVGFGLDYEGMLRNLPYIGTLKKSVYEKTKK
ncbi:hypoxanthine phosphoribosyltransferase [Mycoplasmoides alvi]|uniref:hypoxanthine phosphoribosyltransferase n=1 Tax=Mycoplasmoides alvi TaxID=78580 RepID=UPI0009FC2C18|nr:hypoxanthine phosphoribosyltransferase [Mycoplasmoides alvi]